MAEAERKSQKPGRPRKQKTARQLLARFLTEPLPPGTAKLGCLAAWAEGGETPEGQDPPDAPKTARRRGRKRAPALRMYEGMLLAQMARALEGDLKALQFIRETMGEREEEKAPQAGSLSAGDRALLEKLAARLGLEEGA